MKRVLLFIIVLCTCVSFCCHEDTDSGKVGYRTIQPRLSGTQTWQQCRQSLRAYRVVEETACGDTPAAPPPAEACGIIDSRQEALRVLANEAHCTDSAVAALERFADTDPAVRSDLAAAYYVRAQRNDQPSDFFKALNAADRAIAVKPRLAAAYFNRALTQEAMGLTDEAVVSWGEFLTLEGASDWAAEARDHRQRLAQIVNDATRWQRSQRNLARAIRARDRNTTARLIAPFPSAAERYFEEQLLPRWAAFPTKVNLEELSFFAGVLSARLAGDPFARDVVAAIVQASAAPPKLAALRQGHATFGQGRIAEQTFGFNEAAELYSQAVKLLARGESPFQFRAQLGYSGLRQPATTQGFDDLYTEAIRRGYHHLLARVLWIRAHYQSNRNYTDSIATYHAALSEYARLHDEEGLTTIHSRMAGVLNIFGNHDLAWREAFYAMRYASRIIEAKDRQALWFETADAAEAQGHADAAMLYHDANILFFQKELATQPDDLGHLQKFETHVGAALRHRAVTSLELNSLDRAMKDASDSGVLLNRARQGRKPIPILQARTDEVIARTSLHKNPNRAVDSFTKALLETPADYRTYRASILTQRAEALLLARRTRAADDDLVQALRVLREEESAILGHRQVGADELFWAPYFARFQETYRKLIGRLASEGEPARAFLYAERARSFEPLDLMLRHDFVPPEVHALMFDEVPNEPVARAKIASIQKLLSPGTFVIEYCVLDNGTYAWILSRDVFRPIPLPGIGRLTIERWTSRLQEAALQRDHTAAAITANDVLRNAYASIAAQPVAAIRNLPGGNASPKLVFIPDGAIHGLPLAALLNEKTGRYLIQDAPVEISGSTSLYLSSLRRDTTLAFAASPSVLVIGDPEFDRSLPFAVGMQRLRYADREAREVRSIYGDRNADILTGADATVPRFFAIAAERDIVHVAAHAIVNAQAPTHSLLLLAPSEGNSGVIDTEELLRRFKMDRTRLVVLSTCNSAGGLPVGPEGVAPFVRPLLAAGVSAVVGTLWEVNDNATTEDVMVSFHRHYKAGSDASVAMQEAQREQLLKNNNVLAWAPFQVIGHSSSPFAARAPNHGGTSLGIHSSNSLQRPDRLRPQ
jgi:CHAT domain-containing protein/tetratricopeptide (TPR) repeat protein